MAGAQHSVGFSVSHSESGTGGALRRPSAPALGSQPPAPPVGLLSLLGCCCGVAKGNYPCPPPGLLCTRCARVVEKSLPSSAAGGIEHTAMAQVLGGGQAWPWGYLCALEGLEACVGEHCFGRNSSKAVMPEPGCTQVWGWYPWGALISRQLHAVCLGHSSAKEL